jgi:hypothetical protein
MFEITIVMCQHHSLTNSVIRELPVSYKKRTMRLAFTATHSSRAKGCSVSNLYESEAEHPGSWFHVV